MKITTLTRFAAFTLLSVSILTPAFSQARPPQSKVAEVPYSAVVETIEFKDVTVEQQKIVLGKIGLRVGDVLSVDARHRIASGLSKGMVFSYTSGSRIGTAKLVISGDC